MAGTFVSFKHFKIILTWRSLVWDMENEGVQWLYTDKLPFNQSFYSFELGTITLEVNQFQCKNVTLQNNISTTVWGKRTFFPHEFIVYHSHSGFKENIFLGLSSFGELIKDKYFWNQGMFLALLPFTQALDQLPRPTAPKLPVC